MSISYSTLLIIVFIVCNATALYCCFRAFDLIKPPPRLDPYKDLDIKDLDELRQAVNDLDATAKKFRIKLYDLNRKLEACK